MTPQFDEEYVVQRTLAFILGDARDLRSTIMHARVCAKLDGHAGRYIRPYPPLQWALALLAYLPRVRHAVANRLDELVVPTTVERVHEPTEGADREEVAPGDVDWLETSRIRATGMSGYVVSETGFTLSQPALAALIQFVAEVVGHADAVIRSLSMVSVPETSLVRRLTDEIALWQGRLLSDAAGDWDEPAERTRSACSADLAMRLAGDDDAESRTRSCGGHVERQSGAVKFSVLEDLERWRSLYLRAAVTLWTSAGVTHRIQGQASDLYELWCFAELCRALIRNGCGPVVQEALIRSGAGAPTVRANGDWPSYAYFSERESTFRRFRGSLYSAARGVSPLRLARPEWFIRRDPHEESLVLDAKLTDWRPDQPLKVMGYAMNYGINVGVLVIAGDLPRRSGDPARLTRRLHRYVFRAQPMQRLLVLRLVPDRREEAENDLALDRFVSLEFSPRKRGH